jgi:hypothetical protein
MIEMRTHGDGVNDKDKDAWRAELERRGLENVKLKLLAAGRGPRGERSRIRHATGSLSIFRKREQIC